MTRTIFIKILVTFLPNSELLWPLFIETKGLKKVSITNKDPSKILNDQLRSLCIHSSLIHNSIVNNAIN